MTGPTKRCPHANECDYCGSCVTCGEGRRTITVGCGSCESCMGIRAAVHALDEQQQKTRAAMPSMSTEDAARLANLRKRIEHDDFEAKHCSDPDPDYCHTCDNYADCFGKYDEGNTPGDGA